MLINLASLAMLTAIGFRRAAKAVGFLLMLRSILIIEYVCVYGVPLRLSEKNEVRDLEQMTARAKYLFVETFSTYNSLSQTFFFFFQERDCIEHILHLAPTELGHLEFSIQCPLKVSLYWLNSENECCTICNVCSPGY